jgi:starch phosphorylase
MPKPFSTSDEFTKDAVRHIETTLARSLFNCDESAAYAGTALAFRDRLVLDWNKTQQSQTFADQKRVYCEDTQDIRAWEALANNTRSLP